MVGIKSDVGIVRSLNEDFANDILFSTKPVIENIMT